MISSSSNPSGEIREAALEGPEVWLCLSAKFKGGRKKKKINPQHLPGPGPEVHLSTLSFPAASADRSDKQPPKQPVTAPLGIPPGDQGKHQGRNLVPQWPRLNCGFVQGRARTAIWKATFSSHSWTQNPNFLVLGKFVPELNKYSVGSCHLRRNKSSKTTPTNSPRQAAYLCPPPIFDAIFLSSSWFFSTGVTTNLGTEESP